MTLIERFDGKRFDFDSGDIRTLDFIVESPNYEHNFQTVEGMNGVLDNNSTILPRKITGYFIAIASDLTTSSLLRDEIFETLRSNEPFYITEKRSTNKRWLVKVNDSYELPTNKFIGKFSVEFIALKGVAESRLSTLAISNSGFFNDDSWSFGMGLETENDSELNYSQTGRTFKIFNAGNVDVHPFESRLYIRLKNVSGSSSKVTLINRTNQSYIMINQAITSSDVWTFDGPVMKKNSLSAAKYTDKSFIYLSPGWNTIDLTGATSASIEIDFNYLYL